jgi:hypothetical protein
LLIPQANDFSLAGILAIVVASLAFLGAVMPSFSAAPFTGVLVILVPAFAHVGLIESAVDRVLEVVVGCITALAVSLLVHPARAHSVAIEAAARALELMASCCRSCFKGGVKVTEARRHAARPPSRERRSMPRERATQPRLQSVSACRLVS